MKTDPPTVAPWAECWWVLTTPVSKPGDTRPRGTAKEDGLVR